MASSQGRGAARPRVLVFGGTTEGRLIAEWLAGRGSSEVVVSSATDYGGSLVEQLVNVTSLVGRMPPGGMDALMRDGGFACVVDATHPYATGVSDSIRRSAAACGLKRYRVLREGEPDGPWTGAGSAEAAAALIAARAGRVLLTTGSKDLPVYVRAVEDFAERLFVRVLPVASSLARTEELGIPASHVIAMQGPFSKALNCALIREFSIDVMVTKASGAAGGFWEKVDAARECGIELVVVHRPPDGEGMTLGELKRELEDAHGL